LIFDTKCVILILSGYKGGINLLPEDITADILDVMLYHSKKMKIHNEKRPFSALSFRLEAQNSSFLQKKSLPAKAGSIAFVPQDVEYDRTTDGEQTIVFHFTLYNSAPHDIRMFLPEHPEEYRALFEKALMLWQDKPSGYKYATTALFYEILAKMVKDGANADNSVDRLAHSAAEYLKAHFSDSGLSVAEVAAKLFVSEAYLRRKFHESFGASPKRYLDSIRINHAVSLLKTQYYSQKEIAERCGYSDVKYFRTAFKKHTGSTPGNYHYDFESFDKRNT
jgi:AraC-like DNA-binding protein